MEDKTPAPDESDLDAIPDTSTGPVSIPMQSDPDTKPAPEPEPRPIEEE